MSRIHQARPGGSIASAEYAGSARTARLAGARLGCGDLALAGGLALGSLLAHLPFRTRMLYAWDSVLFAEALDRFNVVTHYPQPPGYLFFVLVARLARALANGSANDAIVWVSAFAAALTVGLLALAGGALFGRATGVVATLLAASSVAFSVYAGVAYPYTTLALGSTLLGFLCWRLRTGQARPWLVGLAFGLAAGFRQDLLLLLGPLLLLSLGPRPARVLAAGGAAALASLLWFVPSALLSGGIPAYLGALTDQTTQVERDTSIAASGLAGVVENARYVIRFSLNTLYLAVAPLLAWLAVKLTTPSGRRDPRFWHLVAWGAPPLCIYTFFHIGEIGYVFSMMPPAWLGAAAGLVMGAKWLGRRVPAALAPALLPLLVAIPVAFNLWWFLGTTRPLSAAWLACKDERLANAVVQILASYSPGSTVLVAGGYYQHARYYLPGYPIIFHEPYARSPVPEAMPPGAQYLIVFDWALDPPGETGTEAGPEGCVATPRSIAIQPGDQITIEPPIVKVLP